jgi:hypothetical protein
MTISTELNTPTNINLTTELPIYYRRYNRMDFRFASIAFFVSYMHIGQHAE